jgi:lysine-N-methylase
MAKTKLYLPKSLADFECTGSACKDNCCRIETWNIEVDAETMTKYRALDSNLAQFIHEHIEERDEKYFMKSKEHGLCVALQEDGLCSVITTLGKEYLCKN